MKGGVGVGVGGQIDPPPPQAPRKNTLKKPSLIRVKVEKWMK